MLVSFAGFHLNMVSAVDSNDNRAHQREWLRSQMHEIEAEPSPAKHGYTPIIHTFIALQRLRQSGVQLAQISQPFSGAVYCREQLPDKALYGFLFPVIQDIRACLPPQRQHDLGFQVSDGFFAYAFGSFLAHTLFLRVIL